VHMMDGGASIYMRSSRPSKGSFKLELVVKGKSHYTMSCLLDLE
jgi:hypothetical protein